MNDTKSEFKVEGKMSEQAADKIANIHAWRELAHDVAGVVLVRLALVVLIWKSPELAAVLAGLIK